MSKTLFNLTTAAILLACQMLLSAQASSTPGAISNPYPLVVQQRELLNRPDIATILPDIMNLELQVLAFQADQPLRLGSIGSAIIEQHPSSMAAQYALAEFYQHVDASQAAEVPRNNFAAIKAAVQATGDGSRETPYKVLSRSDAHTLLLSEGAELVGMVYEATEDQSLVLLTLSRANAATPITSTYFDLSDLLIPLSQLELKQAGASLNNPWHALRAMAEAEDSAAQTAIGTFLAKQRRYGAAINWLEMAARQSNLLAHTLLARIYWYQADQSQGQDVPSNTGEAASSNGSYDELVSQAVDNHRQAIALGSTESMYTLARLYLEGSFATDNADDAVALLEQAGALGKAEAYLYLAYHHQTGKRLEPRPELASNYFALAAQLKNPAAIIGYARYLTHNSELEPHDELLKWLQALADENNAEAMVVIGNLNARGIGTKRSLRKAVSWYKKAVKQAKANQHSDAEIINEVAWTLAVSEIQALQRTRYARSIMDDLMAANPTAQEQPEYLDTWATTYAASGNFDRAVELQEKAIQVALSQDREDVLNILRDHLKKFKAGADITDRAP